MSKFYEMCGVIVDTLEIAIARIENYEYPPFFYLTLLAII